MTSNMPISHVSKYLYQKLGFWVQNSLWEVNSVEFAHNSPSIIISTLSSILFLNSENKNLEYILKIKEGNLERTLYNYQKNVVIAITSCFVLIFDFVKKKLLYKLGYCQDSKYIFTFSNYLVIQLSSKELNVIDLDNFSNITINISFQCIRYSENPRKHTESTPVVYLLQNNKTIVSLNLSQNQIQTIFEHDAINIEHFCISEKLMATVNTSKLLTIWDLDSKTKVNERISNGCDLKIIKISSDERSLIILCTGNVKIYNIPSLQCFFLDLSFSPKSKAMTDSYDAVLTRNNRFLIMNHNHNLISYNLKTKKIVISRWCQGFIKPCESIPIIVTKKFNKEFFIKNLNLDNQEFHYHQGKILTWKNYLEHKIVITHGTDNELRVWDLEKKNHRIRVKFESSYGLSHSGKYLVSSSGSKTSIYKIVCNHL